LLLQKGFFFVFSPRVGLTAIVGKISVKSFIKSIVEGEWGASCSKFIDELKQDDIETKKREEIIRLQLKLNETKAARIPNKRHWRF